MLHHLKIQLLLFQNDLFIGFGRLLVFLLLLPLPFFSFSQSKAIQFRLYDFNDGLTHRNVLKIQQDTFGYIWIATINGLNKYDGHEFTHYTTDDPEHHLPSNYITDMLIDEENQIWMGCGHEMIRMDAANCEVKEIVLNDDARLASKNFHYYNIFKDADGNIWTAGYLEQTGKSWVQKSNNGTSLLNLHSLPGSYFQRPTVQTSKGLWMGAFENELWFSDGESGFSSNSTFSPNGNPNVLTRIVQLQSIDNTTLWVLLNDGRLFYKKDEDPDFQKHPISVSLNAQDSVTSLLVEESGDIWLGGINKLWLYDNIEKKTIDYSPQMEEIFEHSATIKQIFKDKTGVVWVATDFGVLSIHRFEKLFANYLSEGHEFCRDGTCSTRGITEDEDGNIYISYYHSIHVLNPTTGITRPLFRRNRYFQFPYSITYHDKALWTGEGLRIDLQTMAIDTIVPREEGDEGVNMIDRNGNIWFGCADNLCYYDPDDKVLTPFEDQAGLMDTINFKTITYLLEGKNTDLLWIGTKENGIFKLSKSKGGQRHYHSDSTSLVQLSHDRILALAEDNNENLWVASAFGINKIHIPTEEIKIFTTEEGLPNNFINGILLDGDSVLWISTDHGLSRMHIASETFTNFTETDGLSRNEFNRISFYKSSDGKMYFGGLNGVNAFDPSNPFLKNTKEKQEGRLLLTGFSKYDGHLDSLVNLDVENLKNNRVTLSWRDKFFTFRFALADYANTRGHAYSFKLEGYDEDWSAASNLNFARYNNIPAGKYTFKVRASTDNGNWGENELHIALKIEEAFFRSTWFLVLCGLLVAALIYGIPQYRLYLDAQRRKELEKLVNERTAELENEKHKSDELLLNILPAEMAEELKQFGSAKAKRHNCVTVFFSDFKDFAKITGQMEPEELVAEVDHLFRGFDEIMEVHGLEKIKTIGDAYMCVGGIANDCDDEPVNVIKAALDIQKFLEKVKQERKAEGRHYFEARIGINTGPVVAGIVGIKKFAYDIWGDTVNIAARMEEMSEPGKVNISESTYQLVKHHFKCTYRGKLTAKNKGEVDMYFVEGEI